MTAKGKDLNCHRDSTCAYSLCASKTEYHEMGNLERTEMYSFIVLEAGKLREKHY
jgi:hypothetical protein